MRRTFFSLLMATAVLLAVEAPRLQHEAHSQNVFPTGLARSTEPPLTEPADGAEVLVVEGTTVGVCGPTLDEVKLITTLSVNNNRPTITEITRVNSSDFPSCSAPLQYWKDTIGSTIEHVMTYATDWESYWGGIMLDEEDGFWNLSDNVAAFQELNQYTHNVISFFGSGTSAWWFTENFASQGAWTQTEFNQITGQSRAAPQIASDYMVHLTNSYQASMGKPILVTWAVTYPPDFASLYRAESRINGPPFELWSLKLSNCFTATVLWLECGPDDDDDGLISGVEVLAGINPNDSDTENDGCSDGEETGIFHQLGGERSPLSFWDFFDVPTPALKSGVIGTKNRAVTLADVLAVLAFSGVIDNGQPNPGGYDYDTDVNGNGIEDGREYDRLPSSDPSQIWRSSPPNGVISLQDATVANAQTGNTCLQPP
jgi:hypothetical protein